MKEGNNFGLSRVEFINEIFPLDAAPENMPVSFYIDDLKESIVKLSELMLLQDKEDRKEICDIMVSISNIHLLLSKMKDDVIKYSAAYRDDDDTIAG